MFGNALRALRNKLKLSHLICRRLHTNKPEAFKLFKVYEEYDKVAINSKPKIKQFQDSRSLPVNYLKNTLNFLSNLTKIKFYSSLLKKFRSIIFSEHDIVMNSIKRRHLSSEDKRNSLLKKFVPNDAARGMKKLDKSLFSCPVKAIGISVPNDQVADFQKVFKKLMLRITNIRPVTALDESNPNFESHKLVLIDSDVYRTPEAFLSEFSSKLKTFSADISSCKLYDVKLEYNNWNYDEVLKWILPKEGVDGIGGFSIIGHIAHLNLKEELLEYKHIIGQVILDKVCPVQTVINKLQTIDNTFRNFQMEVLAGKEDFVVVTKEHGFTFEFDFSKIYWNPRLSTEHQRIVSMISKNDTLFDVFAGVGPFAVPCAKKGCYVYANDLNPDSVLWMNKNVVLNKVPKERIQVFNMDGREFIRVVIGRELRKILLTSDGKMNKPNHLIHVTMNLPAMAMEFLDAFKGILAEENNDSSAEILTSETKKVEDFDTCPLKSKEDGEIDINQKVECSVSNEDLCKDPFSNNIVIHCYSFSKEADPSNDVIKQVKAKLDLDQLTFEGPGVFMVRNVAPNKEMLRISFRLPWHTLLGKQTPSLGKRKEECGDSFEPERKKLKL